MQTVSIAQLVRAIDRDLKQDVAIGFSQRYRANRLDRDKHALELLSRSAAYGELFEHSYEFNAVYLIRTLRALLPGHPLLDGIRSNRMRLFSIAWCLYDTYEFEAQKQLTNPAMTPESCKTFQRVLSESESFRGKMDAFMKKPFWTRPTVMGASSARKSPSCS